MENQRIRLTKKLLKNALIDLLEKTPLQNVTITEICAKGEINRTTFYKYYSSEVELYTEIEREFFAMLTENLSNCQEEGLEKLFTIIMSNAKIAKILVNSGNDKDFPEKIFSLPVVIEYLNLKIIESSARKEDTITFICNGGYAVIKKWVNSGFPTSPKDLSDFIIRTAEKTLS